MTTKKTLILAMTLLTAGALATSCSSEDNTIDEPQTQQPATNAITLTATLAPKGDDGGTTRAITTGTDGETGKEILNVAWAEGEQVAVYYQKTDDSYATATATIGTPNPDGSAPLTAPLSNAKNGGVIKFVYPATLHNGADDIGESKLLNQNGNLTGDNGISTKFDAATGEGTIAVDGSEASISGTVTMTNRVCICKFRFDIVESYGMGGSPRNFSSPVIINDGNGHTYTITSDRTEQYTGFTRGFNSSDAIYVAMLPFSNKNVTFSTTYGAYDYSYTVVNTTLAAGKFYRNLSIDMVKGGYFNANGATISTSTVHISDGGTLTLNNDYISVTDGYGIECEGDATIILTGANTVTASAEGKPAIFIPIGKTLTIKGDGWLTAESTGDGGAGIGGGYMGGISYTGIDCGNIVIESGTVTATSSSSGAGIGSGAYGNGGTITINGGTVTATSSSSGAGIGSGSSGTCGDITINGGTVTATGGVSAAGIGSGKKGTCGNITIGSGLTSLTATSLDFGDRIGKGKDGTCGTVSIDGSTTWTAGMATTNYTWDATSWEDGFYTFRRWTLTHK